MNQNKSLIERRELLKKMGTAFAAAPLLTLAGCGGGGSGSSETSSGGSSTGGSTTGGSTSNTVNNTEWASGGTSSMTVDFPPASDPLDLSLGNVICTNSGTNNYTLGPCYFSPDDYRDDISEGQQGIPMTLAMKLVDENCDPIVDADIEVWWCNWEGLYSGDTSTSSDSSQFNSSFCTGNDSEALASRYFRGVQKTDSVGNVYFKACFPGWYPSRTTHIHFRVVVNNTERLVSQFCFEDDLCNDIYQNHSDYTGEVKDTNNDRDTVFGSEYEDYQFIVEEQSDGSMLVYKGIQIV